MWIYNKFLIMTYNVGFVTKGVNKIFTNKIQQGDIVWLKHKYKDRYFADPFLIKEDNKFLYVLVEEYPFWTEKGIIVLLKIDKNQYELVDRKKVIEEDWHLSFPYCKLNCEWVIPEASASGKTFAYKISLDTFEIENRVLIAEEGLIDNVFYEDKNGKTWAYAGKTIIPSTELYEFALGNDGLFNDINNVPIQSDNRHSRGAGDFFEYNGKLYRAVQDCKGRYGRQTKIMEIEKIGEDGYVAKEVLTINSFENPPYIDTMHTFNVYPDIVIVDGSKDFFRFPMKIFYKKFRWLFKRRNK